MWKPVINVVIRHHYYHHHRRRRCQRDDDNHNAEEMTWHLATTLPWNCCKLKVIVMMLLWCLEREEEVNPGAMTIQVRHNKTFIQRKKEIPAFEKAPEKEAQNLLTFFGRFHTSYRGSLSMPQLPSEKNLSMIWHNCSWDCSLKRFHFR